MIAFKRINHINICVTPEQLEDAKAFYTDVIGLKLIPRPDHIFNSKGYWFDIGDIQLHIGVEPQMPRSTRHTAFEVENVTVAKKLLAAHNVELVKEPAVPGWDRFAFYDPFRNRIELIQIVPVL